MKLSKFIKFSLALATVLLPTFTSCTLSVAAFTIPEALEDRFAENNIVFYDPCGGDSSSGGGGSGGSNVTVTGCAKLAELRQAMWDAASDEDKEYFMGMVTQENPGVGAVEAYMNQIISKHGSVNGNDGTLGVWLDGQCDKFRGSSHTCREKRVEIKGNYQKWVDEALSGSNNVRFAIGNATGGSTVGAGKIVCVWKDGKCRDDVDYTKQGGTGKCNVYSSSASFGECWGLEGEDNWANDMQSECASSGSTSTSTGGGSGSSSSNEDLSIIRSAKNADESVFNVSDSSEWYGGWSDRDTNSMKRVLEHYGDLAYQLERAIGAPWIAIIVQMRYEDPKSKCGANNFWGNGCPPGTRVGGASRQGADLGEGFQLYAKTLTNGYHEQARGISDPKEYLEKIGPTWVQGNVNGAGYASIAAMKNSVDALTDYVNSSEGQAIVSTFGDYNPSDSSSSSSGGDCGNTLDNSTNGPSIKGEDIAKYAIKLSWPYQGGDDGGEQGKCTDSTTGALVDYTVTYDAPGKCGKKPKPAYKEALKEVWGDAEANKGCVSSGGPCDCTRFTTTVIIGGGFDRDAPKATSGGLTDYLASDAARSKWDKIDDHNNLEPGDVMVKHGHTFIWLGDMGGSWGNAAQASQGSTVAVISNRRDTSDFTAYRLKPRGGNSSTCQFNDVNGDGCTFYCQGGGEDWAGDRYASNSPSSCGSYSAGGCGPTSLAMVITNLTGDTSVTPPVVGVKSQDKGGRYSSSNSSCYGSVADNLVKVVEDYGLKYETIGFNVGAINSALDAGKVVWLSGKGRSPFSTNGHFIAIRGKTSSGKWVLFDSAGGCRKGAYNSSKREYNPQSVINAASTGHTGPYAISL